MEFEDCGLIEQGEKGLLLPYWSFCIFFLSVVDCWLSGVSVGGSCLLSVVECRVSRAHC